MARFFIGLIFILGVVVLFKAFFEDVKKSTPPPVRYDIRADARISPDQKGMSVTNTGIGSWTTPVFSINSAYQLKYPDNVRAGGAVTLPFHQFLNEKGEVFPGVQQFNRFNIQTATMAWSGGS
jgi:hypothetical protein